MKTNFTFDELSKVFAKISKIEDAAAKQIKAGKKYDERSAIFDAEFEKYGYSFMYAPAELQTLFDEKCALRDIWDKAEKKTYKLVKEFASLIEIGNGPADWVEDDIKEYINRRYFFNAGKVADHCKYLAVMAARKIEY